MLRSAGISGLQIKPPRTFYQNDIPHLIGASEPGTSTHSMGEEFPDFGGHPSGFYFKLAQDETSRQKAFDLSHREYHAKGYVEAERISSGVVPYNERMDTRVLMITDKQNQVVATATLVFNRSGCLPAEKLFADEMSPLRAQNGSMFEIVRLAVDSSHQGTLLITARLLNWAFHFGLMESGCDDLLAEVNPRHVGFYTRLLRFERLAKARPCLRVSGAPAVLLRLRRSVYLQEVIGAVSGSGEKESALKGGLYGRFFSRKSWDGIQFVGANPVVSFATS